MIFETKACGLLKHVEAPSGSPSGTSTVAKTGTVLLTQCIHPCSVTSSGNPMSEAEMDNYTIRGLREEAAYGGKSTRAGSLTLLLTVFSDPQRDQRRQPDERGGDGHVYYTIRGPREDAAAAWHPDRHACLQHPHICC